MILQKMELDPAGKDLEYGCAERRSIRKSDGNISNSIFKIKKRILRKGILKKY